MVQQLGLKGEEFKKWGNEEGESRGKGTGVWAQGWAKAQNFETTWCCWREGEKTLEFEKVTGGSHDNYWEARDGLGLEKAYGREERAREERRTSNCNLTAVML